MNAGVPVNVLVNVFRTIENKIDSQQQVLSAVIVEQQRLIEQQQQQQQSSQAAPPCCVHEQQCDAAGLPSTPRTTLVSSPELLAIPGVKAGAECIFDPSTTTYSFLGGQLLSQQEDEQHSQLNRKHKQQGQPEGIGSSSRHQNLSRKVSAFLNPAVAAIAATADGQQWAAAAPTDAQQNNRAVSLVQQLVGVRAASSAVAAGTTDACAHPQHAASTPMAAQQQAIQPHCDAKAALEHLAVPTHSRGPQRNGQGSGVTSKAAAKAAAGAYKLPLGVRCFDYKSGSNSAGQQVQPVVSPRYNSQHQLRHFASAESVTSLQLAYPGHNLASTQQQLRRQQQQQQQLLSATPQTLYQLQPSPASVQISNGIPAAGLVAAPCTPHLHAVPAVHSSQVMGWQPQCAGQVQCADHIAASEAATGDLLTVARQGSGSSMLTNWSGDCMAGAGAGAAQQPVIGTQQQQQQQQQWVTGLRVPQWQQEPPTQQPAAQLLHQPQQPQTALLQLYQQQQPQRQQQQQQQRQVVQSSGSKRKRKHASHLSKPQADVHRANSTSFHWESDVYNNSSKHVDSSPSWMQVPRQQSFPDATGGSFSSPSPPSFACTGLLAGSQQEVPVLNQHQQQQQSHAAVQPLPLLDQLPSWLLRQAVKTFLPGCAAADAAVMPQQQQQEQQRQQEQEQQQQLQGLSDRLMLGSTSPATSMTAPMEVPGVKAGSGQGLGSSSDAVISDAMDDLADLFADDTAALGWLAADVDGPSLVASNAAAAAATASLLPGDAGVTMAPGGTASDAASDDFSALIDMTCGCMSPSPRLPWADSADSWGLCHEDYCNC